MKRAFPVAILLAGSVAANAYQVPPPAPQKPTTLSRRGLLRAAGAACLAVGGFEVAGPPNDALAETFIGGPPMIKSWPSLQYLVPIYELENSLKLLSVALDPARGAEGVKLSSRLVEQFFKGGLLSNKNVFKGLCAIYVQEIRYDDPDKGRVRDHGIGFLDDCDATIRGLEQMQKPLKKLADSDAGKATPEVIASLDRARAGMKSFLSKVPQRDMDRVVEWTKSVAAADADRNGRIEGNELDALSEQDRDLYKAVGDFLGK